jgi:hypothetical protein
MAQKTNEEIGILKPYKNAPDLPEDDDVQGLDDFFQDVPQEILDLMTSFTPRPDLAEVEAKVEALYAKLLQVQRGSGNQ